MMSTPECLHRVARSLKCREQEVAWNTRSGTCMSEVDLAAHLLRLDCKGQNIDETS